MEVQLSCLAYIRPGFTSRLHTHKDGRSMPPCLLRESANSCLWSSPTEMVWSRVHRLVVILTGGMRCQDSEIPDQPIQRSCCDASLRRWPASLVRKSPRDPYFPAEKPGVSNDGHEVTLNVSGMKQTNNQSQAV